MKKLSLFLVLFSALSILMTNCKKDPVPPTLSTSEVSDVSVSTAKAGGAILDEGGAAVTDKGIAFSQTSDPTLDNNIVSAGGGVSDFTVDLENLTDATLYYVRAYATNSAGTSYGNQVSFTTPEATVATVTTRELANVTFTTAESGGDIASDGGSEITAKGICWSTSENPTVDSKAEPGEISKTEDGTGTEGFSSNLAGLSAGTTYYVRAYATNSKGTAYGNQLTFTTAVGLATLTTKPVNGIAFSSATSGGDITSNGSGAVTAKGICWSTTQNPTVAGSHTTNGAGNEGFVSNMTGLNENTTYYVRAYATNSAGTAYGNQLTFTTTTTSAPVVTTAVMGAITATTAVSGGNVTSDGGLPVTQRGVVWGIAPNPTTTGNRTTNGTGAGVFASNITGLGNGTVYYVRAYATNSKGTSYGNEVIFVTSVTDVEGNVYRTLRIGNQVWMAENLKTTIFRNNAPIPFVTSTATWIALDTLHTPAYSWYDNNLANKGPYGGLYNWFAVGTGNLCPAGWHVPTDAEFQTMERTIGVPADSLNTWGFRGIGTGTHLKNSTGWTGGNGDNTSGFTAVPAGYRAWTDGTFRGNGGITYFWLATDDAVNAHPEVAWYRRLDAGDHRIFRATTHKGGGKSIRCLKD